MKWQKKHTSPLAKQYNTATKNPWKVANDALQLIKMIKTNKNVRLMANLKWVESEIDEVLSIKTPALHAFICQHHKHHFMDSQQRNQDQCGSDQTGGHKTKSTVLHYDCKSAHGSQSKKISE